MEYRNRRGGITPAEGCMYAAVVLFVILLVSMLFIAYLRFGDPPPAAEAPPPAALVNPRAQRLVTTMVPQSHPILVSRSFRLHPSANA